MKFLMSIMNTVLSVVTTAAVVVFIFMGIGSILIVLATDDATITVMVFVTGAIVAYMSVAHIIYEHSENADAILRE